MVQPSNENTVPNGHDDIAISVDETRHTRFPLSNTLLERRAKRGGRSRENEALREIQVKDGYSYLAFTQGQKEYGLDLDKVQEIRSYKTVNLLPDASGLNTGVSKLRGDIVPVVDIRLAFNAEPAENSGWAVVVIMNIGKRVVGMVVDGVSNVVTFNAGQIRPLLESAGGVDTRYVKDIGISGNRKLHLVDIESLISGNCCSAFQFNAAS